VSGTGGAFDGDALLYQGTLLVEFDVERMVRCLRIPADKIRDKAIADARERVVNLKDLLGAAPAIEDVKRRIAAGFAEAFGVSFERGAVTPAEEGLFEAALAEIDTEDWIHLVRKPRSDLPIVEAAQKFAGGMLRAAIAYDRNAQRVKQVWFTGDIFVNPRRTLADLEAALKDCSLENVEPVVVRFFAERQVDMLTLAPADFVTVVRQAAARA
jgi:lipoate-protein ligase A